MAPASLVADLGGTHARLAQVDGRGRPGTAIDLPSGRITNLVEALRAGQALLGGSALELRGGAAAVAVAGPVRGDEVSLTNVALRFSIEDTRRELGLARLVVLNDFAALALSIPSLTAPDLDVWRAGEAVSAAPRALLGPGTGLGVAALIRAGGSWQAVPGEGGHRDLAASEEREWRVVEQLRASRGHVSAEAVLSGPGLVALHGALAALDGAAGGSLAPEEISRRAAEGADERCREAIRLFSGWLGAVAGDLVLTLGARGGLFLAGGVLAGLGPAFERELFFARFGAKGRMSRYLDAVPVARIAAPDAALRGAARALREAGSAGA